MIRPITADDIGALLTLVSATGLFSPDERAELEQMLNGSVSSGSGADDMWVTDDDERDGPVGVVYYAPERMTEGTWNMYLLAVRPDYQGQGRGTALVRYVEQALQTHRCPFRLTLPLRQALYFSQIGDQQPHGHTMFRIGEFSKLAQVSSRLLRYYDEIDLFAPAFIDQQTGYRYYSAHQLPQLNRILVLKELALSLEQVARLLKQDVSIEEIRGMLTLRKAQIELHEVRY